jgi:UDP:flavonoid glycosyltransferase YjiC (YdhE family)
MTALAHGVPLLCLPMGREQHDNAARVAACGAGCVLTPDADVAAISQTIRVMLAVPEYRTAARHVTTPPAKAGGFFRTKHGTLTAASCTTLETTTST